MIQACSEAYLMRAHGCCPGHSQPSSCKLPTLCTSISLHACKLSVTCPPWQEESFPHVFHPRKLTGSSAMPGWLRRPCSRRACASSTLYRSSAACIDARQKVQNDRCKWEMSLVVEEAKCLPA